MCRTLVNKGRSAFRDVVFGVSRSKRLSVVDVEELGKARQELDRRGVVGFGDGVRRRAHPLSCLGRKAGMILNSARLRK